ncbi:MAG: response regulator [Rhodoferax sp.]|uniref:response regulator n=1 Tax=Rhodoferax sp. TaxID=50421 RepID=UPI002736D78D|nr:response regulator [Rhodoferax sp.]MDP3863077.1 response regulator [Rhodoferax sp.]
MNTKPKNNDKANDKIEILIAEDSPTQAAQLIYLLEQNNYKVTAATNGREALALLEKHRPALVISDVNMPELGGYGLCKAIKSDDKLKHLPVMLVTTLTDPDDVIRGLECGADNFIRKPYEEKYLLSRINYLLMNVELRTNQRMQMALEINLGGHKHAITAERQQMLDLLISTYEQAVGVNGELKQREKELSLSNQVLQGLNRIAEGLNSAVTEKAVAEMALQRALELPGIHAGWIFLRRGESSFYVAATCGLPPALTGPEAFVGDCACKRQLLDGTLAASANIIQCERLARAREGTGGLCCHASIPLWLGNDQPLGVMNLAGSVNKLFNEAELKVLHSVGNQVAVALERAQLHEHLEQQVAERTARLTAEIGERKRIEQEQARLVAIIEATPDLVGTATPDGQLLYTNQAGLRMMGIREEDLPTLRIPDVQPEWAAKLVQEVAFPHALSHGHWRGETAILGADGHEIPVLQVILVHRGLDGAAAYMSTIARDITQRKIHEARIARLNRIYAVLSGINTTIMRVRDEGELFSAACRIALEHGQFAFAWIGRFDPASLQVTPVAQAGRCDGYLEQFNLVAGEGVPGSCALTTQALTEGKPAVCNDIAGDVRTAPWRAAALGLGYLSVTVLPLLLEGRAFGVFALYAAETNAFDDEEMQLLVEMSGDIGYALDNFRLEARRKQAEDELRKLSLAVSQSPNSIVITGLDATIEYVNEGFIRVTGYSREEVIGKNPRILHSGKTPPEVHRDMWAHLVRDESWKGEFINRRKDGSDYVESIFVSPVHDTDGRITHYLAIKEDVTERKQAEAALLQLNETLEQRVVERTVDLEQARCVADAASLAKSAFLATMSHEIRTPMNGVIGMADVLAQSSLTAHQVDLVNTIRDSANSLLGIIDDILDFSKIEAGRLELEREPVCVADLVEGLCNSLVPVASRKGVELTLFVAPETPERVLSDDVRLRQVLYNLLGNAIKFSGGQPGKRGRVLVRVEVVQTTPLRLALRIADNGIGMTPATLAELFTPFSQAEVSTTRRYGGTGLGLTICKRLVDLMQGEISVESTPGAGSAFTVTLPFELAAEQPVRSQPDLSGLTCILLESPDLHADDLRRYLAHAGADVYLASDTAAVLRLAEPLAELVVLVLAADMAMAPVDLAAEPKLRQLLITRGVRRRARVEPSSVVTLDGNALRRLALLRAVAVAAGRASPEVFHEKTENFMLGVVEPPTIAEARSQGCLILVVEDDEINQKVILRQLALLGYAAEIASNGVEALRLWRDGRYALVLTDLHMPEMDGYTLADTIRREEAGRSRVPILALTANALRGEANRARAAGLDEYMTKPVQLVALRAMLGKWMPQASGSAIPTAVPKKKQVQDKSIIDVTVLEALVGDDPAIVNEFLTVYLASSRDIMEEMRVILAAGDSCQVGALAHKLKSSSRAVGALALGDLCAELENLGKTEDMAAIEKAMVQFKAHLTMVEAAISLILVDCGQSPMEGKK